MTEKAFLPEGELKESEPLYQFFSTQMLLQLGKDNNFKRIKSKVDVVSVGGGCEKQWQKHNSKVIIEKCQALKATVYNCHL